MEKTIDLHVHSLFSDGKKNISEMIQIARDNNVGYLSFTEHYNMSAYNVAKKIAPSDIEIIPGIEVGTDITSLGLTGKNHKCHILVYYPSTKICIMLDKYEENREVAIRKILELLNKKENVKVSYSQVAKYARNSNHITRFDVAITLAKLGLSQDPITAYGEYLDFNSKCYVSRHKETPTNLIRYVKKVGGVTVLAHPKSMSLSIENEYSFIKMLVNAGLDGIEVYNPHNDDIRRTRYLGYCNEFELIPTVGSDYHGLPSRPEEIGKGINNNLNITDITIIERIKKRAGVKY
ncbi:MAG: PHP domain-containing protein [Clostridia bacterium]|nr:PHP domain-containing protein [Clostridia bacterium]